MTPEELNRTIEFIVQSQARLATAQEQDREWTRDLLAQMERTDQQLARILNRQTELLDHQSQRMDRLDKFYEDWLRENRDFQRQALHLLNTILDRLPPMFPTTS
jgi:hypothetical protein